ncbi:MAG: M48 family metallopeptidase [Oligoflexia bacterium]|nr:M48 family metallopeptidase [Oligoflexia bacterium]
MNNFYKKFHHLSIIKKILILLFLNSIMITILTLSIDPFSSWLGKIIPLAYEEKIFNPATTLFLKSRNCVNPLIKRELKQYARMIFPENDPVIDKIEIIPLRIANAFALPGGHIIITSKLIEELKTAEALLGVLAHEKAHIELRHISGAWIRTILMTSLWSLLFGDISGILVIDPMTIERMSNLKYSRDLELAADLHALGILRKNSISPQGLISFLEKLHLMENSPGGTISKIHDFTKPLLHLFSTHPDSLQRANLIRAATAKWSSPLVTTPENLSLENWKKYQNLISLACNH